MAFYKFSKDMKYVALYWALGFQEIDEDIFKVCIKDNGVGIKDIKKAREPFYTTKKDEERSGMGFTLMETFMDTLDVNNNAGGGISVLMTKRIFN